MENLLYKRKSILTTFKFLFLGELLRHHSVSSFMHVVKGLPPSRKSCAFKVDSSQILDTQVSTILFILLFCSPLISFLVTLLLLFIYFKRIPEAKANHVFILLRYQNVFPSPSKALSVAMSCLVCQRLYQLQSKEASY